MAEPDAASVEHSEGRLRAMPMWARIVLAAKWMRIAPWELMNQDDPEWWIEAVGTVSNGEAELMKRKRK